MIRTTGILITLCAMLAIAFAPATTGSSPGTLLAGDASDGRLLQTEGVLDGAAHCGGNAPNTIRCTNEHPHDTPPSFVAHGFRFPGPGVYNGYISSTLTDENGNVRHFHCNVVDSVPTCPRGVGSFPTTGTWKQECLAHGVGDWECWSDHN